LFLIIEVIDTLVLQALNPLEHGVFQKVPDGAAGTSSAL
jgi:hypothetical protein